MNVVKVETVPWHHAQSLCVDNYVCPVCRQMVRLNDSIACQSAMTIYHAACFRRRVQQ